MRFTKPEASLRPQGAHSTDDDIRMPPGPALPSVVQTFFLAREMGWFLQRCQQRYGDCFTVRVVRGERLVCVAHPDLIGQVFNGDPEIFHGGEHNLALGIGTVFGSNSLLMVMDGEEHLRQRRLVAQPFQPRSVRRYRDTIAAVAEEQVASWPSGRPFPLFPRMRAIALEVILRTGIGETDPDRLAELRRLLPRVAAFDILPLQLPVLFHVWPWREYLRTQRQTTELLRTVIAERRKDPGLRDRNDVLSLLVSADGDEQLTDDELRTTLLAFLIGGHDTTATALSWTFERLMRHPDVMARLTEAILGDEDDDAYLDAVARETLRIRPVISLAGRKLTRPAQIGEYRLPAGVNVLTAMGLVQKSSRWFPDSETYRPERFLDSRPHPYTWVPFGGGDRRCLGAAFAVFEIKTVLRAVLSNVKLTAPDPRPERPRMRNVTLVPKQGARAIVYPRSTRAR